MLRDLLLPTLIVAMTNLNCLPLQAAEEVPPMGLPADVVNKIKKTAADIALSERYRVIKFPSLTRLKEQLVEGHTCFTNATGDSFSARSIRGEFSGIAVKKRTLVAPKLAFVHNHELEDIPKITGTFTVLPDRVDPGNGSTQSFILILTANDLTKGCVLKDENLKPQAGANVSGLDVDKIRILCPRVDLLSEQLTAKESMTSEKITLFEEGMREQWAQQHPMEPSD